MEDKPYVSSTTIVDGKPMYMHCPMCNGHTHRCLGCGEDLTHSGHEYNGKLHDSRGCNE